MELAPRIHEGHSEGRAVPGSRADSTHSLGRWFRRNCISFKTILFPPVEESEVLIGACQEELMVTSLPSLRTDASSQQHTCHKIQPLDTMHFPSRKTVRNSYLFLVLYTAKHKLNTATLPTYQPLSQYVTQAGLSQTLET